MRLTVGIADDPIEGVNLGVAGAALATSLAFASPHFAASVAVGAILEIANFRALRRATGGLFRGEIVGARPWTGLLGLRLVFVAVGMSVALSVGASPAGLAIGLSTIVPAVVWVAWRTPPPMVRDAFALPPEDPGWDAWNPWLAREGELPAPSESHEGEAP